MASLTVTVVQVDNFKLGDASSSDLYVVLNAGAEYEQPHRTSTKHNARGSVTFNETFKMGVGARRTLNVYLYDHDAVGADDALGSVAINIDHFASQQPVDDAYRVDGGSGGVVRLIAHLSDPAHPPTANAPCPAALSAAASASGHHDAVHAAAAAASSLTVKDKKEDKHDKKDKKEDKHDKKDKKEEKEEKHKEKDKKEEKHDKKDKKEEKEEKHKEKDKKEEKHDKKDKKEKH